jgi:uncharacterized membrane protein
MPRRDLVESLGFLPAVIVIAFAAAAIGAVEIDEAVDAPAVVFQGDADAARTLLSVIAGSLITVAGLVFSMTLVVLQLASSQFSPRVLRTFFGDRLTQATIGTYVGTFVFALLVLRSVGGSQDGADFVPRISITVVSSLGVLAVVLLIVFLHHVSQLIQVSHVMRAIGRETLEEIDRSHPDEYSGPCDDAAAAELLDWWRSRAPGSVWPEDPGFVERVDLKDLVGDLAAVDQLALLVRPGDFVSVETPLAEVWPAEAADRCAAAIRAAVRVGPERSLDQDLDFGLRQLTDTAVRAMSPAMNDPTTAVTCVGYVRSALTALSRRALPSGVLWLPDRGLTVVTARRTFDEHLAVLDEVARYARDDPRVEQAVLAALRSVVDAAVDCGAFERATAAQRLIDEVRARSAPRGRLAATRRHAVGAG